MEAEREVNSESVDEVRADQLHSDDLCPSVTPSWRRVHQAFNTPMVKGSSGARAHRLESHRKNELTCMWKQEYPDSVLTREPEGGIQQMQQDRAKSWRGNEQKSPPIMEASEGC